jgi:AcrR family transcriptional regulator
MPNATAPAKTIRRRKDARPSEIIDAAAEVFAQYGYAATNLDRIAELAEVSKGTIYRYFEDKDVLFAKVIEAKLLEPLASHIPMALPLSRSAGTTLRQALTMAYEMGKQSRLADLVKVLILEGERFMGLRKTCLDRFVSLANQTLRSVMDQHDKDGRLKASRLYANPAVLFFPIACAVAMYGELKSVSDFDMDRFVEMQIEMVCAALDLGSEP